MAKEIAKASPEPRPRVAQDWQVPMKGWMCPACDYHNWAKRTECRECNWHKEAGVAQLPRSPATESTKSDSSSEVEIVKVVTIREPTEQEQDLDTQIADTAALISWMAGRDSMTYQRLAQQEKLNQLKAQLDDLKPTAVRLQVATARLRQQHKALSSAQDRLENVVKDLATARLAVELAVSNQDKAQQEVNQLSQQLAAEGAGQREVGEHPALAVLKNLAEILQMANNAEGSVHAVAAMRAVLKTEQGLEELPKFGEEEEPEITVLKETPVTDKQAKELRRQASRERSPRRALERAAAATAAAAAAT